MRGIKIKNKILKFFDTRSDLSRIRIRIRSFENRINTFPGSTYTEFQIEQIEKEKETDRQIWTERYNEKEMLRYKDTERN